MIKQATITRWLLLMLLGLLIVGCGESQTKVLNVGIAFGRGGLGDRSFNDSAYAALKEQQTNGTITFSSVSLNSETPEEVLKKLAQTPYDVIFVMGQEYAGALATVAPQYPNQRWALIDATVEAPNVTSVIFNELEGDFLAGALAALLSKNGHIGFIGGAETAVIWRIHHGWEQGALAVRPEIQLSYGMASKHDDFTGFSQPEVGTRLANELFEKNVDVVYVAAGRTGLGSIDAAQQADKLAITTGSDQRWIGTAVIASRTKNIDVAINGVLDDVHAGTLASGQRVLTIHNGGIDLTPLDDPRIPADVRQQIDTLRAELINGQRVIPTSTKR